MKKTVLRLLPGVLFSVFMATVLFSGYVLNLYFTAQPGFRVSAENREYSPREKEEIVTALVRLSQIADSLGLQRFHATLTASAGVITGGNRDSASELKAKYYFSQAIAAALDVANRDRNHHPLLETHFAYGLFLKDIGDPRAAIRTLEEGIEWADKNDPGNHWKKNLERALESIRKSA